MRALGVLIVVLGAATVVLVYVNAKFVRPALRRRHIAQLEAENRRLDELLSSQRTKGRR